MFRRNSAWGEDHIGPPAAEPYPAKPTPQQEAREARWALEERRAAEPTVSIPVSKLEEWSHYLRVEIDEMMPRDEGRYSNALAIENIADDIDSHLPG